MIVASLKISKRLILKNLLPLPAPFQHFHVRVRFRFQSLSSKRFRFHKELTASTASASTSLDPFEEMSLRWKAVGNTVFDLTGPRFEPYTSRSRYERVRYRSTNWPI